MKMKRWTIGVLVLVGLLVGSLGAGALLAGQPGRAAAAPAAQTRDQCVDDDGAGAAGAEAAGAEAAGAEAADTEDVDNVEEEVQCGPQDENDANETGQTEADDGHEDAAADTSDETAPTGAGVTAAQAQAVAEAANAGAATLAVEFDREGGKDIWEVELNNGLDVKVDASNGQILLTETRD